MGFFPHNDIGDDILETDLVFDSHGELISAKSPVYQANDKGILVRKDSLMDTKTFRFLRRFNAGRLVLIAYGRRKGYYHKQAPKNQLSPLHKGKFNETNLIGLDFIRKLKEYLAAHGSRLIVFIIPQPFMIGDYPQFCPYPQQLCAELRRQNYLHKALAEWFDKHNIEYICPLKDFIEYENTGLRLHYKWDGHWTKAGHKAAAELISDYLKTHSKQAN